MAAFTRGRRTSGVGTAIKRNRGNELIRLFLARGSRFRKLGMKAVLPPDWKPRWDSTALARPAIPSCRLAATWCSRRAVVAVASLQRIRIEERQL